VASALAAALQALEPVAGDGAAGTFSFTAQRLWCSWNSFYGGALLAALIAAMEKSTAQPLLSASAQFLGMVVENDALEIRSERLAGGGTVVQARAVATRGGKAVASANAVLGAFDSDSAPKARFPQVPAPLDSPPRVSLNPVRGGLNDTLEARVAGVDKPNVRFWVRCPTAAGQPLSSPLLAALADYPPPAVTLLLGGEAFGITLDETLRVTAPLAGHDAGGWTLLDVHFDALPAPFALATVNIWSERRVLLGIGTQTMRVRHGVKPQTGSPPSRGRL
jgi:acyl-CoA thioesterase